MSKIGYGSISVAIVFMCSGLILILSFMGIPIDFFASFSIILLSLAIWTLIYGFKFGGGDRFWIVNGLFLLILSASLLSYSIFHSLIISFSILLICIGVIIILASRSR